jgi:hypothetical protein
MAPSVSNAIRRFDEPRFLVVLIVITPLYHFEVRHCALNGIPA